MNKQVQNQTQNTETMNQETPTKQGFPIKTLLLIVFLAFIATGLITLAVFINKPAQTNTVITQPTQTIDPVQTTLTISSTPIELATPSAYSSDIIINTGQNTITKVQLELQYDPKVLTKVDITPGPFLTNPQVLLKNIDKINGRVTFALGIQDGEEGILGQGVIARINFSATQKVATTSVSLLPKTEVKADGYSMSVLKATVNALFNLNETPFKATRSAK